jgi:hypothetical protein
MLSRSSSQLPRKPDRIWTISTILASLIQVSKENGSERESKKLQTTDPTTGLDIICIGMLYQAFGTAFTYYI